MQKHNTALHEFDPVIYPSRIWVGANTPFDEISSMFYSVSKDMDRMDVTQEWYESDQFSIATTVPVARRSDGQIGLLVIIWRPKLMTTGIICHESTHCADYICDHLGVEHGTFDSGEAYAYLTQWIAECIESVKKNSFKRSFS